MFSLSSIMSEEVKKALKQAGISADVINVGNQLVVTIKKEEIIEGIHKSFPEAYRNMINVEASDIRITIKIM